MNRIVKNYMLKEPIVIKHSERLIELIELFEMTQTSHLVVVNDEAKVIGMITRTDLYKKTKFLMSNTTGKTYTNKYLMGFTAKDIMTKYPIVLKPEDSLGYAAELLLENGFNCLPVVNAEEPVGILTVYNVMEAYYKKAV